MRKILDTCQVLTGIVISIFYCFPAAAATFNVIGTEKIDSIELSFLISDFTGIGLPTKLWSSKTDKFQDENTEKFQSLKYWDVNFKYDSTKNLVDFQAFHIVDPHDEDQPKNADIFIWNVPRPNPIDPVGNTGALKGMDKTSDRKDHIDSLGKHSDSYNATISYTTNLRDLETRKQIDQIGVEITGKHCPNSESPTPDKSIFSSISCPICNPCSVAVPEPLNLFGIGTALGFATFFKSKLFKKHSKKSI